MITYDVEVVDLEAQPVAVVRGHVTQENIAAFLGRTFGEVLEALAEQGVAPAGPPFGRFLPTGDGFDVEAGFPSARPVAPSGRVEPCQLPAGPAARVVHRGDYGGVAVAYETVAAWVASHGYVATEPPWESYLDGPEVAEPRTVVYLPCRLSE
jgi:effector-binding domain-containing protein